MNIKADLRTYEPEKCAVFCKTKGEYGGNSNMAGGFPLQVNAVEIKTAEALFQASRFPGYPHVQQKIIQRCSPVGAKMAGQPYRKLCSRPDWERVKIAVMRWCLRVKLLQNWEKFSAVLLETGNLPIVELSTRGDDFWGTVIVGDVEVLGRKNSSPQTKYLPSPELPVGSLIGYNIMGRLNWELRESIKIGRDQLTNNFTSLPPLLIPDFLLYGEPILPILRR